jgi:hypothetical protein
MEYNLAFPRVRDDLIGKYAPVLVSPTPPAVRDPRLLMERCGDIEVFYAPFEYLNPQARVVLVGITPGPTQMVEANNEARRALLAGSTHQDAIRQAKKVGAFSGKTLRTNLVNQLNHWGVHEWLGLENSSELFDTSRPLVHTTSLLRFPVFVSGQDYRGNPDMTKHPMLRKFLLDHFITEVAALSQAVFVGLGPQVQKVLESLTGQGLLAPERVINGMLHPSGNCTYRIQYLTGDRKGSVPHATNPVPYDAGRSAFRKRFLRTVA